MIVAERPGHKAVTKVTLRGWSIWTAAALFYLYEFFLRAAPSSMTPELQRNFHLDAAAFATAAGGFYYWIYSPIQLVAGSMMDRFGAKVVLVPAALICTLGCFLETMGHSMFWLCAARFCQGLGSAFAFVGTMYLAAEWFPQSMLGRLSGLTTALGMMGAIIGNAGIAWVVTTLGWKIALVVGGFVGVLVTFLLYVVVPFDAPWRKTQAEKAALPRGPGLLRALLITYSNPQSWYAGIAGMALYMPLAMLGLWGVEYLVAVTGGSKEDCAGAISMLYVGWLFGGPIAGWYSDRTGLRRNLLLGAGIATLITTLGVAFIPHITVSTAYLIMLLLGLASTSQVVCFVTAMEHNPPAVAGTAIAATNMIIMLGGGAGETAFGFALEWFAPGHKGHGNYPIEAFHKAFLLLPVVVAVGVVAAYLLKEASRKKEIPAGPEAIV
ncbi:MFS transporter [soil metagenome]